METNSMLLVVLIAALLVTVGLQTVQLAAMGTSGAVTVKSPAPSSSVKPTGAVAPTSLQKLPSMVGGC